MVGHAREQERARERRQMSYELHDTLTQDLVSGILELDTVRSHLNGGPDEVRRALNAVERALRDSLQVTREMAFKYHDEPNAPKDVRVDLESVVDEFRRSEKIAVKFEPVGKILPMTNERSASLEAALREGLSNVRKHSRASFVQVTFSQMENGCALDVRDDGLGMSVSPLTTVVGRGGFGLVALRQRVEALGGQMIIESAAMQGTTLSIQFPSGAEPTS
jgi:signal transduction histidine kinase